METKGIIGRVKESSTQRQATLDMHTYDLRGKYRPKRFSEFVGNKKAIKVVKGIIKSGRAPMGILFHGPPGSGKTSLAYVFVKGLYCENFTDDVCDECHNCKSFNMYNDIYSPLLKYSHHDCTKINLKNLGFDYLGDTSNKLHRAIHIFDEFHRAKEPIQEFLLSSLEHNKSFFLIFCSIGVDKIKEAFGQRVMMLPIQPPEYDEIIPWLKRICELEGLAIKDAGALKQVGVSANRLPRECLSLLEKIKFLDEPLTTTNVKEAAQDKQESHDPQYTPAD